MAVIHIGDTLVGLHPATTPAITIPDHVVDTATGHPRVRCPGCPHYIYPQRASGGRGYTWLHYEMTPDTERGGWRRGPRGEWLARDHTPGLPFTGCVERPR